MLVLFVRRILLSLLTLGIVALTMFVAVDLLPGDACTAYLGRSASETKLADCRQKAGLDRALPVRFVLWSARAASGDLGLSMARKKPVSDIIAQRFRNSAVLALAGVLIAFPVALVAGILAALRRDGPFDLAASTLALGIMTIPEFVAATALVLVLSIWLQWLPAINVVAPDAPLDKLAASLLAPALVLAMISVAHVMRIVRASVIEVLAAPYVEMARLRGIPGWRIVLVHVLPNALMPAISVMALQFAWLLSGVVVVEVVFNYPGLGRLTMDAISDRDLPLVLGLALLSATIYIACNLLADLVMLALNPRAGRVAP